MDKKKSRLEEKVLEGVYGQPELKAEEKRKFLGEFEERVLRYLTVEQVTEPGIYPEIAAAIKDPGAKKLVIDRQVDLGLAHEYIEMARENNLLFKRVDSPGFKGEVGLVIVSDQAVERKIDEKKVVSRRERLQGKGISDKIIENVGHKLCGSCWSMLADKAPEELSNYQKMSWLDRVTGTKCVCEDER